MTLIHSNPRERSRWSLTAMAGALIFAIASLTGCAGAPLGPLVAPSPVMYLADGEPRALGPLKRVPESDVLIVEKDVPNGTITVAKSTFDMDSNVRAANGERSLEMRFTQHHGSVVRVKNLGETKQGLLWFRFDYLRDEEVSRADEESSKEPSPVAGKSYLVEVGRGRPSIFTWEGGVPRADEVSAVMEDSAYLLPLVNKGGRMNPTITSDFVARATRNSLVREGVEVGDVKATYKGVRDTAGAPCAIFDLSVSAVMTKSEADTSVVVNMKMSGEYAVRLADGWEAELFLTGTAQSTGHMIKDGISIQVSSAGVSRFHMTATYREPEKAPQGAVVAGFGGI